MLRTNIGRMKSHQMGRICCRVSDISSVPSVQSGSGDYNGRTYARGAAYRCAVCAFILLMFTMILSAGCIEPSDSPVKYTDQELNAELRKLKSAYYNASMIVEAQCRRSGVYGGVPRSDFVVDRVFAGHAAKGQAITCEFSAIPGDRMLLYLDLNGSDKYIVTGGCAFLIDEERNVLLTEKVTPPIEDIAADINKLNSELRVPFYFMHYNNIASLVNHCDEVILGRIEKIGEYETMDCRSFDNGETTKRLLRVAELSVIIEDGFGGKYKKDDILSVKLIEEASSFVIRSEDLDPMPDGAAVELKENDCYIMFLNKSEDKKQDSFFTVNPYQGFVQVRPENGRILVQDNTAMFGIDTIREFKDKLERIRNYGAVYER